MRLTSSILLIGLSACDTQVVYYNPDLGPPDLSVPPMATVLASTVTLTNCLALDQSHVYWVESSTTEIPDAGQLGRLMQVPKSGGNPSVLLDAIDAPGCAVADDQNVYVTRGGDILAVAETGGQVMTLAQNQHVLPMSTPRLAALGGSVYWITDVYGAVDAFTGKNALVRVSASSGGVVDTLFTDITGSPGGIAVDASNVYYSDLLGMYLRPLAGGAATPIGTSVLHNNRFAVDDLHLVLNEENGITVNADMMTQMGSGDVAVFNLDGSGRVQISMNMATALTLDHANIYANSGGKLTRLPIGGGPSEVLDGRAPRAVAIDATDLYFTDGSAILRFAK